MLDIVIPISFLAGAFTAGFIVRGFSEKYRMRVMLSITKRVFDDAPAIERLERAADTWHKLSPLITSQRGALTGHQYFALVLLASELNERLDFDSIRETDKQDE